jgi:hypothetical protein
MNGKKRTQIRLKLINNAHFSAVHPRIKAREDPNRIEESYSSPILFKLGIQGHPSARGSNEY